MLDGNGSFFVTGAQKKLPFLDAEMWRVRYDSLIIKLL